MSLFTPTNQKKLTNVAVVRMKKGGKRFEIACYPNKVKAWRDKIETNINEVLQTQSVFINVSKGQLAKREELLASFNIEDQLQICQMILSKGELQVTEKERHAEKDALFKDVAQIVADRCVNPDNNRCYPVSIVEKMMHDCHINLKPNKTAKQQALDVIRQLRGNGDVKIVPALMNITLTVDKKFAKRVKSEVTELAESIVRDTFGESYELEAVIEPGKYRVLEDLLRTEAKGKFSMEVTGFSKVSEEAIRPAAEPDASRSGAAAAEPSSSQLHEHGRDGDSGSDADGEPEADDDEASGRRGKGSKGGNQGGGAGPAAAGQKKEQRKKQRRARASGGSNRKEGDLENDDDD